MLPAFLLLPAAVARALRDPDRRRTALAAWSTAVAAVGVPGPTEDPRPLRDPCPDCRGSCGEALERALAAAAHPDARSVSRDESLWLAVRDACPLGREHRYSDEQIRYGYTKDRSILAALA